MFCKNCGTEIGSDVKFCPKCGQSVDESVASTSSSEERVEKSCDKFASRKKILLVLLAIELIACISFTRAAISYKDSANIYTSIGNTSSGSYEQVKMYGLTAKSSSAYMLADQSDTRATACIFGAVLSGIAFFVTGGILLFRKDN